GHTDLTKSFEVNVRPMEAAFEVDYRNYPDIKFVTKSPTAQTYTWNFGDKETMTVNNANMVHHYKYPEKDSEQLLVEMNVADLNGCKATFQNLIMLYKNNEPVIPNVFTPNDDNTND